MGKKGLASLQKQQGIWRASLTKALTAFEDAKTCDSLLLVEVKATKLKDIDEQILQLLYADDNVTQDEIVAVIDEADAYQSRVLQAKESIRSEGQSRKCLPKLDLQVFELTPRVWVSFWAQYEPFHLDKHLHASEKLQYLKMCLAQGSAARKVVDSFPPSEDNYVKVIDHLTNRFGSEELIVDALTRDILQLVLNRSHLNLADLYDQLGSKLRGLETLGFTTAQNGWMLYPLVEACLSKDLILLWERARSERATGSLGSTQSLTQSNKLDELMEFLRKEVDNEARVKEASSFQKKSTSRGELSVSSPTPTAAALHTGMKPLQCILCDEAHKTDDCKKVLTVEAKRSLVAKKRGCFACLKRGHTAQVCRGRVSCAICRRKHNTILCLEPETNEGNTSVSSMFAEPDSGAPIYMKTLVVIIKNGNISKKVRILLDDGSHRSYIDAGLAEELSLEICGRESLSHELFGGVKTKPAWHSRYKVRLFSLDGAYFDVNVLDQKTICSNMPRLKDQKIFDMLQKEGIQLSDVGDDQPEIKMLLGADAIGGLLTGQVRKLHCNLAAVETKLGWTVIGYNCKDSVKKCQVTYCMKAFAVPSLWELETMGIHDVAEKQPKEAEEAEVLEFFEETLQVNEDGRYEVGLPWLKGHPPLPTYRDVAEARLHSVTAQLSKKIMLTEYDKVLTDWQNDGIIEEVPEEELTLPSHYLSHHPVFKPSSTTTPIRPVFNASSKKKGHPSLNECLSVGPSLIKNILPLLIKFRLGAVGAVADIKKAFLQLSVRPEERDYLRFIWWKTGEVGKQMKVIRHCRVVFGVNSSPFLLNAVIHHHLNKETFLKFETTIKRLQNGFYVDNLLTSVDDILELEKFKSEAIEIMNEGKFELREWAYTGMQKKIETVLGLNWDLIEDTLFCSNVKGVALIKETITKRELLSIVSQCFDPIGYLAPLMLVPKLLLQDAWRSKIGWDDPLPAPYLERFIQWSRQIDQIHSTQIPRRILFGNLQEATLHVFSDACTEAYAGTVFLRSKNGEVRLVAAKSRIGSINRGSITIPRMELLGAALAVRLYVTVKEALGENLETILWTDSSITLSWITQSEPWNTFVGNRVQEIRKHTEVGQWRFVPGKLNIADFASRPCSAQELINSNWWEGPAWLCGPPDSWPNEKIIPSDEALCERKKVVLAASCTSVEEKEMADRFTKWSSYRKTVRICAWARRIFSKGQSTTHSISVQEFADAEYVLFRLIQATWPDKERQKRARNMVFVQERGLLVVKTRLSLADFPKEFIEPIVLPDHHITRLLIVATHERLLHSGVAATLAALRERFWIPRGRKIVRAVVDMCKKCKRHSTKPFETVPAPLPIERIEGTSAFAVTGADLLGPLFLKNEVKVWVILFTCAVYRAVHFEILSSLSSEALLGALTKFQARRGRVSILYTDNGTNFKGFAAVLDKLTAKYIEWRFIPPKGPWFGGWWERLIAILKSLLIRSLGRAVLEADELYTVLCACEDVMNQRPLTYVNEKPDEPRVLRPVDFLRMSPSLELPNKIVDAKAFGRRAMFIQKCSENLQKRFIAEYVGKLIESPGANARRSDVKPGDVVLVEDTSKRLQWPMAVILELMQGRDGEKRVAKIRTEKGILVRPLKRLYPLETNLTDTPEEVLQDENEIFEEVVPDRNEAPPEYDDDDEETEEVHPKAIVTRRGRNVMAPQKLDL